VEACEGIASRIDSSNRNEIGIGNQLDKGIEVTEMVYFPLEDKCNECKVVHDRS